MARTFNRLTPAKVRNAKVGLHADGLGLYLQVTPGRDGQLNKSWFFRFARDGRERRMGLGKHTESGAEDDVTLAKARAKAADCRAVLDGGLDPIKHRDDANRMNAQAEVPATFRNCFEALFTLKSHLSAKRQDQWRRSMEVYVFPHIGKRPVAEVTPGEIIEIMSPIWRAKPETARQVLQRVEAVFNSAIFRKQRLEASPTVGVRQQLGPQPHKGDGHRWLSYQEVPDFILRLRVGDNEPATKLAVEWLILTATRSGETRLARWDEIDEKAALWTIPRERTKTRRQQHVVPLPERCLEILRDARVLYPASEFVFPGLRPGMPLAELTRVPRDLGLDERTTIHGFRKSFKTWASEAARARDEISEACLAHTVPGVRGAYLRTDFLQERKALMAAWASYCTQPASVGDTVVQLRQRATA